MTVFVILLLLSCSNLYLSSLLCFLHHTLSALRLKEDAGGEKNLKCVQTPKSMSRVELGCLGGGGTDRLGNGINSA